MTHYVSDVDGIGGRLRDASEHFRVRELERIEPEPIDADPGAYAHVVLRATLRRWDTNDFASALSDRLGISRERVNWAGTKDKHAVTTQLFSVSGIDPGDLPIERDGDGAADDGPAGDGAPGDATPDDAAPEDSPPPLRDADLVVLGRLGRSIELGDLAGNEFAVTVADPECPENVDAITAALAAFGRDEDVGADVGEAGSDPNAASLDGDEPVTVAVPNYFGQQRFGSRRPITHEVGLAIVRRDWREAVRTYVAEDYESEPESTREARRTAGDCVADGDLQGALDAMPNRLGYERALLHDLAEQDADSDSAALDYRAALDALPENLQRLFVHAAQSCAFNRILSERLERGLPFARPVEGDVVCFADADAPEGLVLPDTDRTQRVTADRVETVTRHCERDRAFVTAPLLGTDSELGDGEPGEIERAVLADLDLSPEDFDLPDPFGSTGTRRAILVRTDLAIDRSQTDGGGDRDAGSADGPTFEFALPKGSYATVLLREFLKGDPVDLG